jgi:hypothetical protein
MDNLMLEKTAKTPAILFNKETGIFRIEGRSIPEDPDLFYSALINWLEVYYSQPKEMTEYHFQLEYINSGSSKFIMALFQFIRKHHLENKKCQVYWYYEEDDENIRELGQHYHNTFKIPFKFIELYN